QQVVVGQAGRSDLVRGRIELLHEVDRRFVPTGSEPGDLLFSAIAVDVLIRIATELEPTLQVTVGRAERILSRLRQLFGGVHDLDGALLELPRVRLGHAGHGDPTTPDPEVAVVVDADFPNDVGRATVTH